MNFTKQVKRVWAGNVESKERKKKKKITILQPHLPQRKTCTKNPNHHNILAIRSCFLRCYLEISPSIKTSMLRRSANVWK